MIIKTQSLICQNENLLLTNQRAIFWQKQGILIVSDLHIGKTAHFRRSGIPISSKVLQNDLLRLKYLIDFFDVKKVLVVGDMFHAEFNEDIHLFSNWLKSTEKMEWLLIKGNHDKWPDHLYISLSVKIFKKSLIIEPFTFVHDVKELDGQAFYISGHIHPGVSIKGRGKQRIKLPCYQIEDNLLRLPAFSVFTGLNTKKTTNVCEQYAFTDDSIFKI